MKQHKTSVAERNLIVDQKLAGYTLAEIAAETGWSFECVRQWWRRYRDGGRPALSPPDGRQDRGGRMSQFAPAMRTVFSQVKAAHPGWGAEVAQRRIAAELGCAAEALPSVSTIEKYWAMYHPELVDRHRKRRPTVKHDRVAKVTMPHERWQLDFKEWIAVPGCGHIDVLNIRDEATPVKIGSFVYPARKSTGRDIQHALRCAFDQWGLCDRLQTDRDKRLFNTNHRHPFPTVVLLWLAGLGIRHDIAPSAPHNGCVERFNRTWFERVILGSTFESLAQIQAVSDNELTWMNWQLPSDGRDCHHRPPLVAYPDALQPRRPFSHQTELDRFALQRVYDFLASQFWWRQVTTGGQASVGGHRYTIGTAYAGHDVCFEFDAHTAEFVVFAADHQLIKRLPPRNLTIAHITGLKV